MARDLAGRLRVWARGPGMREAVELVVAGGWLERPEFVDRCVFDEAGIASLDWTAIDAFAADRPDVDSLLQAQSVARRALLSEVGP